MLKPSSSRRETKSSDGHGRHAGKKSIGCMSGLFHLLSRHHHTHSRKRLASRYAGKQEAKPTPPPAEHRPPPPPPPEKANDGEAKYPKLAATLEKPTLAKELLRRHSCDSPRSPTLPPEIRRSCSAASPCSPRQPPALVARLMGLEDGAPAAASPEPAAEKRRKLLGALEKCDEDLKALKRIIDAVRSAAEAQSKPLIAVGSKEYTKMDATVVYSEQQPSPVSVLEAISSPRCRTNKNLEKEKQRRDQVIAVRSMNVEEHLPQGGFILGINCKRARDTKETYPLCRRALINKGLLHASDYNEGKLLEQIGLAKVRTVDVAGRRWRPRTRSEAMVETVGEVWEDGVWEERWEVGRVGVGLEIDIFEDLIEEVVMELMICCYMLPLPLGTCRKRLYF